MCYPNWELHESSVSHECPVQKCQRRRPCVNDTSAPQAYAKKNFFRLICTLLDSESTLPWETGAYCAPCLGCA